MIAKRANNYIILFLWNMVDAHDLIKTCIAYMSVFLLFRIIKLSRFATNQNYKYNSK